MSNVATSSMSHQTELRVTSQNQQWTESQCRKCGKKNHSTTQCCKKVTCKQCKGKGHSTKYCITSSQSEPKCIHCKKDKHTTEDCKVRKKAEKKLEKSQEPVGHPSCLNCHINYFIESITPATGPSFTDSSSVTSGSTDNVASAITNSWNRRKATVTGPWS